MGSAEAGSRRDGRCTKRSSNGNGAGRAGEAAASPRGRGPGDAARRPGEAARAEIAAGVTVDRMITELGVSTAEVVEWCCGAVTAREVARLRRLAARLTGSR